MQPQSNTPTWLLRIMSRLRGRGGSRWDREKAPCSLRHNLVEECYEVLDAMDSGKMSEFRDELGDLLLQIVFHAQMADESGEFDFDAVAKSIADKLVRRHPHVFGKKKADTSAEVLK